MMLCLCLLWGSWKCRDGGPGLRAVAGYRVLVWLRDAKDAGQRTVLPHYACESSKIDTTSPGVGPQSNSCVGLGMGWATRRGAYARAVIVIDLPSSRPSRWDWTPGEMGKKDRANFPTVLSSIRGRVCRDQSPFYRSGNREGVVDYRHGFFEGAKGGRRGRSARRSARRRE
ncbi:hypothetical protein M430DRAFT_213141 [Amorphotheca resinae ATCC 22711]|uniref:Secreted protein n=1 Tax=Amorphotheca resinae ATCC 22711 TaxID=857342 RepID=A0A2T3B8E0_AMORE|nr:hypothetical protein M430DRAFT_213141 [Amorphotheca resinae ATCC 22711]PSS23097.1 hypothetical protein M430DRAFT_213141 [Amorphotheca resinae ATCC 22711]